MKLSRADRILVRKAKMEGNTSGGSAGARSTLLSLSLSLSLCLPLSLHVSLSLSLRSSPRHAKSRQTMPDSDRYCVSKEEDIDNGRFLAWSTEMLRRRPPHLLRMSLTPIGRRKIAAHKVWYDFEGPHVLEVVRTTYMPTEVLEGQVLALLE